MNYLLKTASVLLLCATIISCSSVNHDIIPHNNINTPHELIVDRAELVASLMLDSGIDNVSIYHAYVSIDDDDRVYVLFSYQNSSDDDIVGYFDGVKFTFKPTGERIIYWALEIK